MIGGGYNGKLLRIDLTRRSIKSETLNQDLARRFLGGRGYAVRMLYDENPPGVDPFAPDNRLIFMAGPFIGTDVPSAVKCDVVTRSPLSGTVLMSLSGGQFGAELKRTGYDGLVITGRASGPVYIQVHDDDIQIKDAAQFWGKDCLETQEELKAAFGDKAARIATTGPAGERLVKYAGIINERHTFGRGGAGAVMGSKNLKAVLVRGTKTPELFDPAGFARLVKEIRRQYRESPAVKAFSKYGTARTLPRLNERGILPTRNSQSGVFEGASRIDAEVCLSHLKRRVTCYRCPVGCSPITAVAEGPYAGIESEGPEFETVWSFGAQCGNDYFPAIIAAEVLCDRYGLDTISTGNSIGFAMECFEKGLITSGDTGGLDLRFGNHEAMVEMVRRIGERDGFGDVLAEGVRRVSEKIGDGCHRWAIHVKGLEMSGYEPRGAAGQGLAYATSSRGGDHNRALVTQEVFGFPLPEVDRFAAEGKAALVKSYQDIVAILDSLGICYFNRDNPMGRKDYAALYTCATGIEVNEADLLAAGERIWNLERLFNRREGFSRKDDTLPERLLTEPLREGPAAGHVVPLEPMLDDYYAVRGWDSDGHPVDDTLERLGLEE